MRQATIILKAMHGCKIRQIGRATADIDTLTKIIQDSAPMVSSSDAKDGLRRAAWSDGVTWIGGHQIGIEVLGISNCDAEIVEKTTHLDD